MTPDISILGVFVWGNCKKIFQKRLKKYCLYEIKVYFCITIKTNHMKKSTLQIIAIIILSLVICFADSI